MRSDSRILVKLYYIHLLRRNVERIYSWHYSSHSSLPPSLADHLNYYYTAFNLTYNHKDRLGLNDLLSLLAHSQWLVLEKTR